jgi:hypothetical protein
LWDYDVKNMDYLKIPKRAPEYWVIWFFSILCCSILCRNTLMIVF